jgi:hypothetical protein
MNFNFATKVTNEFGFLCSDFNFSCINEDQYYVLYESQNVFIGITFDGNRSYELGVNIGFKNITSPGYSLGEILKCFGGPAEKYSCIQVTTPESLSNFLVIFSDFIKKYAIDLLKGDNSAFQQLKEARNKECHEYAIEQRLAQMRCILKEAWHTKNYVKVVELLTPLEQHITQAEHKKLEYAKEKL